MRGRSAVTVFVVGMVVSLLVALPVAGQSASTWTLPRTPDGHPDLQGAWSFATITPLERPSQYEGRELLSEEEVAALNADAATRASSERRSGLSSA